ncbi:MAG: prepilin-type N-terminal cleavage/methylation domain-containing protein [Deltaproteobacteria bacterium]|nr:prepilin-type N-terminal cleavage/methylation domain-containing protein [Deltaproteobacteria bacterium]
MVGCAHQKSRVQKLTNCHKDRARRRVERGGAFHASRSGGFTLIELLVVLTIISLLASIAVPIYQNSVTKAKEAALRDDLYQMREAMDKYYADNGEYPAELANLVEKKYIRTVPVDPFTRSADTWVTAAAEEETGIYDVHSGSTDAALDGSSYAEW